MEYEEFREIEDNRRFRKEVIERLDKIEQGQMDQQMIADLTVKLHDAAAALKASTDAAPK